MDVNGAGKTPAPPLSAAGPNPWESEPIRLAVAALNDEKASAGDKLTAYKAITDLIASTPSQGGAARVAVVTDKGFERFAAYTNDAGERLNRGAAGLRNSEFTSKQLSNFDAMSTDDQDVLARLSPFGTREDYRAHLQASAEVGRAVEEALATGDFNHISQVKDRRFDSLKQLVQSGYAPSNSWTQKARDALSRMAPAEPRDAISLSPEAKALLRLQTPDSVFTAQDAALQTLRSAAEARGPTGQDTPFGPDASPGVNIPYRAGSAGSRTV
jgi:hypothetical protein